MKRHLQLLDRQASAQKFMVVNLDDPEQVKLSEQQERDGQFSMMMTDVLVHDEMSEPLNRAPKGKEFDLY